MSGSWPLFFSQWMCCSQHCSHDSAQYIYYKSIRPLELLILRERSLENISGNAQIEHDDFAEKMLQTL